MRCEVISSLRMLAHKSFQNSRSRSVCNQSHFCTQADCSCCKKKRFSYGFRDGKLLIYTGTKGLLAFVSEGKVLVTDHSINPSDDVQMCTKCDPRLGRCLPCSCFPASPSFSGCKTWYFVTPSGGRNSKTPLTVSERKTICIGAKIISRYADLFLRDLRFLLPSWRRCKYCGSGEYLVDVSGVLAAVFTRPSGRCQWGFWLSGMWPCVVGWMVSDISKECSAFICKGQVEKLIWEPPRETVLGISLSRCRRGGDKTFVSSVVNWTCIAQSTDSCECTDSQKCWYVSSQQFTISAYNFC